MPNQVVSRHDQQVGNSQQAIRGEQTKGTILKTIRTRFEIFNVLTVIILLGFFLWLSLAIAVNHHAQKQDQNAILWFLIVLVTGVFGVMFYLLTITGNSGDRNDSVPPQDSHESLGITGYMFSTIPSASGYLYIEFITRGGFLKSLLAAVIGGVGGYYTYKMYRSWMKASNSQSDN